MSGDKDSVAPERIYVQLFPNLTAQGLRVAAYERDPREVHDNGKPVYQYIRDDGDLISLSTVVKRLKERIAEAEQALPQKSEKVDAAIRMKLAELRELKDEFEAADKDLELK